jgi:hypothetical protein
MLNGEFVYGYLSGENCIANSEYNNNGEMEDYMYFIDHDTIGQCTGRKDERGTLVFEDDLLKNRSGEVVLVVWDEYECRWGIEYAGDSDSHSLNDALLKEGFVVVGNSHDNPDVPHN